MTLCLTNGCRKLLDHRGQHDAYASTPWAFMAAKDKDKLSKAGFATPRGGAKGAYQNHVLRSNKVIVPYERLGQAPLTSYGDGYVVRLFPDQYFDGPGQVKATFTQPDAPQVGADAFVLYRTHDQFANFPPLPAWNIRSLTFNGAPVAAGRDRAESAGQCGGASAGRFQPAADLQETDSGAVQHQRAAGHLGWHCSPGGFTLGRP